jgi:hypothetical protein
MNWIDKANKQLEQQRANFQESLDSGIAGKRGSRYGSIMAGKQKGKNTSGWSKAAHVNGGKSSGLKNVESGHLEKVRDIKKARAASLVKVKCVHCGIEAATFNHARWHGDNCKTLKIITK